MHGRCPQYQMCVEPGHVAGVSGVAATAGADAWFSFAAITASQTRTSNSRSAGPTSRGTPSTWPASNSIGMHARLAGVPKSGGIKQGPLLSHAVYFTTTF